MFVFNGFSMYTYIGLMTSSAPTITRRLWMMLENASRPFAVCSSSSSSWSAIYPTI